MKLKQVQLGQTKQDNMNPEIQRQLDDLQRQIDNIRTSSDIEFSESFRRNTLQDLISAGVLDTTVSGLNQSIGDTEAFTSPKDYDIRLRVEVDGSSYYLGLHNV